MSEKLSTNEAVKLKQEIEGQIARLLMQFTQKTELAVFSISTHGIEVQDSYIPQRYFVEISAGYNLPSMVKTKVITE